ncbi:MAG: UDP-N-acetylmuramoyl-L-alanyl-D-glutamate--2,6-diaminopimelate ligase [Patescibacteria group bacterium]
MKTLLKKIIPKNLLNQYYRMLALFANYFYLKPAEKMVVIGVTGTNGKSTTCLLIAKILEEAGYKAGITSTAIFKVADQEWLNDIKMTMPGRLALQKMLKRMLKAGCRYAVVETSSEGIKQFRHLGIHYDLGVFTNLTPEHIESHGGFANYKKAKLKLFEHLEKQPNKIIANKKIKEVIVANGDDEHVKDFLNFKVDEKYVYQVQGSEAEISDKFRTENLELKILKAEEVRFLNQGIYFRLENIEFNLKLFGRFNVYNALAAIAVALSQGVPLTICKAALEKVEVMPGRMEFINEGQDFKFLVDYAPEPESMKQLYQAIDDYNIRAGGRIIHIFGSCGGGRDKARRPILGQMVAQRADFLIITNEDPYDDSPQLIIDQVAQGAQSEGKVVGENLFKILDRREAIKFALNLAKKNDLIILTGKACEQAICVANGQKIPWDDRKVARGELKMIKK